MKTLDQLQQVFCNNFTTYYASHVAHVNVVGRNFVSDHELLKGIYEDRQAEIDTLAEIIRTLDGFMIDNLKDVTVGATIKDAPTQGSADVLLMKIHGHLTDLVLDYQDLMAAATADGLEHISNHAQDQVTALEKQLWQLKSTLEA